MQYMLLIYSDQTTEQNMNADERGAYMSAYQTFTQDIAQKGQMKAGDALEPTSTARTVRVRDGQTLVTDGPFAETREQLGGYYLVEAADLDEALQIASRIPTAAHGSIEVRPVMIWD